MLICENFNIVNFCILIGFRVEVCFRLILPMENLKVAKLACLCYIIFILFNYYMYITKYYDTIIHPKDIHGLHQEDTINMRSFLPYIYGVLLMKTVNIFWVYYSWFLLVLIGILFCYFIFYLSFLLHFLQLDCEFLVWSFFIHFLCIYMW